MNPEQVQMQMADVLEGRLVRFRRHVGEWLRSARLERGWSLRELQARSRVSHSEIFKLETSEQECRLESFIRLASALGAPPGGIMDDLLHFASRTVGFVPVVLSDPQFEPLAEQFGVAGAHRRELWAGFIAGWCNMADILVRSGNAYFRVVHRVVPTCESMREPFERFAKRWDDCEDAAERLGFLRALWLTPISELRAQGLLPDAGLREATGLLEAGTGDLIDTPEGLSIRMKDARILSRQDVLTISDAASTVSGMKREGAHWSSVQARLREARQEWRSIRKRLAQLTKRRGAKSALARHLGVTRAAVGEWLAGNNAPSASTLLRLLVWMERAVPPGAAGFASSSTGRGKGGAK